MFRMAAYTDIGPRKQSNQDSVCGLTAQSAAGETAIVGVCDGVGGLASGELASATVAHWFSNWFESDYPALLDFHSGDVSALLDAVRSSWDSALFDLNYTLQVYGRSHFCQLGTTCTMMLLVGGQYLIAHVGDTRAYRFANGSTEILTTDQTWVAQEVARGNISPEKARFHPKRNIILQSVGTQSELQPVFYRGSYEAGDAFMVCCDGFRNELFDDEILNAFAYLGSASESAIRSNCEALAKLVLDRGERDNVSVIALSVQDGSVGAGEVPNPTARLNDPDDPKTTVLPQISDDAQSGRWVG